jgi:predicted RNA methylase
MMAAVNRKIHTLFYNPREVARKYLPSRFKKVADPFFRHVMILLFFIKRAPVPIYYEGYNAHWNYFSFKDKIVLDLGADYGSTAYFFCKKGASRVIAVEGNRDYFVRLQEYALKYLYIVPIELMVDSEEDITQLISKYSPDIVKVDIEGAERLLLICPLGCLTMVDQWLIETHEHSISDKLIEKFSASGFLVKRIQRTKVHDVLVIEKDRREIRPWQ